MGTTLVGRVRAGDRRGVPRRFLTLMPMLPSGFTSGRSLCVEPATPMSARGWTRGTRARGNGDAGHARPAKRRHFSPSQKDWRELEILFPKLALPGALEAPAVSPP